MMYKDQLAVAIKSNGKILRETKDVVHLPFGSEFSVLVKNLNSRRVKFKLSIDGADALDDTEIIVNANSEAEVKRFIRNGNMNEGNAFKFIERTQAIEDGPRGIKIDDGVVRVEFWFEKERPEIKIKDIYWEKHHYRDYYHRDYYGQGPYFGNISNIVGSTSGSLSDTSEIKLKSAIASRGTDASLMNCATAQGATYSSNASAILGNATMDSYVPTNDAGITVPGSKVEQKFEAVYGFQPEVNSQVIVLKLVGRNGNVEVTAPITVKSKQKCVTCGKVNKASSKFCTDCGTNLTLI